MSEIAKEVWTEKQIRVQEWLASPRYTRAPITQEMLAQELGISDKTILRWKKLDGFLDAVNALARATIGAKLPEIYGALLREAEKGSFPHIKMVLELSGDYVEKQQRELLGEQKLRVIYGDDGSGDSAT